VITDVLPAEQVLKTHRFLIR